jgi:hypothetical protein
MGAAAAALGGDEGSGGDSSWGVVGWVGNAFEDGADHLDASWCRRVVQFASEVCGVVVVERPDVPGAHGFADLPDLLG